MASSVDKQYGDMFVFGKYDDGRIDLVFRSNLEEFTIQHITNEEAENLMRVWQAQRDAMHDLIDSTKQN